MQDPYSDLSIEYFEDKYREEIFQEITKDVAKIFTEVNEKYTKKEIELLSNFVLNTYSEEGVSPEITLNMMANNAIYAPNNKEADESLKIFEFIRQLYYYTYTYQEDYEKQKNLKGTISSLLEVIPKFSDKNPKELVDKISTYQYVVHSWYMVNYVLDMENIYIDPYIDQPFEDEFEDVFVFNRMPELPKKIKKKYSEEEFINKIRDILRNNRNN